ncbi:hypothetical protein ACGFX4_19510 [Kitasatospora sp. NPDC048365]|uniref:hypothetical protein n=1 Tax=Kitasatospora sp. NPDC048365 TaxID=3364050 RepID=UPI0037147CEE
MTTPRRSRRNRIVLWCALAGVAAGGVWVVSRPHPGDLLPGLGPTSSKAPAAVPPPGAQAAQPPTEAQAFTAERYFPAQRTIDQDGYRARRTAARQGADCVETQADRAHDALKDLGCQAYVAVAFSRADQPVVTSVTVLRFNDAGAAAKAAQALGDKAAAFAFTLPDGTPPPAVNGTAKPMTAARVAAAGHYLTVTVSRYADQRAGNAPDQALQESTRAAAYVARAPFSWM